MYRKGIEVYQIWNTITFLFYHDEPIVLVVPYMPFPLRNGHWFPQIRLGPSSITSQNSDIILCNIFNFSWYNIKHLNICLSKSSSRAQLYGIAINGSGSWFGLEDTFWVLLQILLVQWEIIFIYIFLNITLIR